MNTPIYGVISYTGNQYTVVYRPVISETGSSVTGSLTGYGKFPFSEYPNLPVIDFENNDNVCDCLSYPTDKIPQYGGDLKEYLNFIKSNNVNIIYGGVR